ncbi:MAG: hypothetical protein ACYSTR_07000 [Planctomycetota bacterium]
MRCTLLFLHLVLSLWVITGCEVPEPNATMSDKSSLGDLKLSDLEDNSREQIAPDLLMSFRILTYTVVPGQVDELQKIFDLLSQKDIRIANKSVFEANGFSVGTGSYDEGVQIAQELARIGAVRIAHARLTIPHDKKETISRAPLKGNEIIEYTKSENNSTTMTPKPGFLGWVMVARPDPRLRGTAQIKLFPAYWQPGIEAIRLRMGLEPIEYQPVSGGQVLTRIEEQGIVVLGPSREMPDETTLDKMLFFLPGRRPKIQLFVINCDSVGT